MVFGTGFGTGVGVATADANPRRRDEPGPPLGVNIGGIGEGIGKVGTGLGELGRGIGALREGFDPTPPAPNLNPQQRSAPIDDGVSSGGPGAKKGNNLAGVAALGLLAWLALN